MEYFLHILVITGIYIILTLSLNLILGYYVVMRRIVNSPFGRILRGIREDEIATLAMGKDVNRYKLRAFIIGAFFAGIAGGLYAHYITFIDPSSFTVMESITVLLMVVFGGMGSLTGSFLGASVLVILPELLRFLGLPSTIFHGRLCALTLNGLKGELNEGFGSL